MTQLSYEELLMEIEFLKNKLSEEKEINIILTEQYIKYSKAFHNSPLPIVITKLDDGTLIEVNEMFTKISGYTREEVIGRTTVEINLIKPKNRQLFIKILNTEERIVDFEIEIGSKDGRRYECLFNAEVITFNNSKYLLSIVQNITARIQGELILREINEALHKAKKELKKVKLNSGQFLKIPKMQ